jgi:hypothetical protein
LRQSVKTQKKTIKRIFKTYFQLRFSLDDGDSVWFIGGATPESVASTLSFGKKVFTKTNAGKRQDLQLTALRTSRPSSSYTSRNLPL